MLMNRCDRLRIFEAGTLCLRDHATATALISVAIRYMPKAVQREAEAADRFI
jgi:hypothetical protein